ncbi:MAG: response regulator transcription factor [Verrucomicrobiales bacterium]|nr:response regulator transcription factor [Verrucomicrobiales bacterium]
MTSKPSSAARCPIKVLIVDDHPVVRRGLSLCLSGRHQFTLVGEAADGPEALRLARALRPHVVLLDLNIPQVDGVTVTATLRRELPTARVLILSSESQQQSVMDAIRAGASGFVLKTAPPEELVQAIETVRAGGTWFSSKVAQMALNRLAANGGREPEPELTAREREVLIQIAEGLSNKEIAAKLGLGVRTVETHRERIMRKLNIHHVAGLTKYALARGWVSLESKPAET